VGPRRADGFHELSTVYHAIGLCEQVTAVAASGLSLTLTGPEAAGLAADGSNLAWQAAALLAEHAGRHPDVHLTVCKQVPVAAGLAGGSADAAATLLACDRLWQLDTPADELAALAARLGSDVAFCLLGRTALGTGRGEHVTAVPVAAGSHWVIAAARLQLDTPAVYRELDRLRAAGEAAAPIGSPDALIAALATAGPASWAGLLGNDLQAASLSLAPELEETLATGRTAGALAAMVSGSGPTCVFLAADAAAATRLAAELNAAGGCRFALAVTGDVAVDVRPTPSQ
jgi:4-diphosphocytidyl-2-C-methyl-D-erythritol kinase